MSVILIMPHRYQPPQIRPVMPAPRKKVKFVSGKMLAPMARMPPKRLANKRAERETTELTPRGLQGKRAFAAHSIEAFPRWPARLPITLTRPESRRVDG